MATWKSDKINAGTIKQLELGYSQDILATAVLTTALALNDIIQMVNLEGNPANQSGYGPPYGPTITGVKLGADNLDSASSLTLDVGDSTSAQRFIAASTIGQGGGTTSGTTAACLGYAPFASSYGTYTTTSYQTYLVQIKVHAAAGTAVAGNARLLVSFNMDP